MPPSRLLAVAKEGTKLGIFASLVGSTYLAGDGRQVKKLDPLTGDDEADAEAIELKAMQTFVQTAQFAAQTAFSPALSPIYMEHALSLADFQVIAADCPTVPLAHAKAVDQGLYAGYLRDFVAALHILLAQFEYIVRTLLKSAGVRSGLCVQRNRKQVFSRLWDLRCSGTENRVKEIKGRSWETEKIGR